MGQKVGFEEHSSLETTGHRIHIVTGIVYRLLTWTFSSRDNIEDTRLKGYLWSEHVDETKILIQPVYKWDAKRIQGRPGLVIKRNSAGTDKLSIGHGLGYKIPQGESKAIMIKGSHVVFCLGGSGE